MLFDDLAEKSWYRAWLPVAERKLVAVCSDVIDFSIDTMATYVNCKINKVIKIKAYNNITSQFLADYADGSTVEFKYIYIIETPKDTKIDDSKDITNRNLTLCDVPTVIPIIDKNQKTKAIGYTTVVYGGDIYKGKPDIISSTNFPDSLSLSSDKVAIHNYRDHYKTISDYYESQYDHKNNQIKKSNVQLTDLNKKVENLQHTIDDLDDKVELASGDDKTKLSQQLATNKKKLKGLKTQSSNLTQTIKLANETQIELFKHVKNSRQQYDNVIEIVTNYFDRLMKRGSHKDGSVNLNQNLHVVELPDISQFPWESYFPIAEKLK